MDGVERGERQGGGNEQALVLSLKLEIAVPQAVEERGDDDNVVEKLGPVLHQAVACEDSPSPRSIGSIQGGLGVGVSYPHFCGIWYWTASATCSIAISLTPARSAIVRPTRRHRCAARALSENDSTAFCRRAVDARSSRQNASSSARPMSALARTRGRSTNRRCWIARATSTRPRMAAESSLAGGRRVRLCGRSGEPACRSDGCSCPAGEAAPSLDERWRPANEPASSRGVRNNSLAVTAGTSTCMSIRSSNGPLNLARYNCTCRGVHLHGFRGCPRKPHGHPCVAILQFEAEKPETHW